MTIGPRHTAIRNDAATSARQNAENARDLRDGLAALPNQRVVVVEQYTAVGSTSAKIPILATKLPAGVQLIRAAKYFEQGEPLALTPNFNFALDSTTQTVGVFEPSGLTADVVYTFTFLITEG
jgi:hypothetical protein